MMSSKMKKYIATMMAISMMMSANAVVAEELTTPSIMISEEVTPQPPAEDTAAPESEEETEAPATEVPATEVPATEAPATEVPATPVPVTEAPVTEVPATPVPVTEAPVTEAPATPAPVTEVPVTEAPATEAPVTEAPVTEAPATPAPVTEAPVTEAPATEAPVTEAPVTEAPATEAPATEAPATEAPAEQLVLSAFRMDAGVEMLAMGESTEMKLVLRVDGMSTAALENIGVTIDLSEVAAYEVVACTESELVTCRTEGGRVVLRAERCYVTGSGEIRVPAADESEDQALKLVIRVTPFDGEKTRAEVTWKLTTGGGSALAFEAAGRGVTDNVTFKLRAEESTETDEPETTEAPEVTEAPESTETEAPETTEAPEVTEAPESAETEAPETTEAPEVTEAPETTEAPEVTEVPEATEEPADEQPVLDPDAVHLSMETSSEAVAPGDVWTLTARVEGLDGWDYTVQWQYAPDGEAWQDIPGATGEELAVTMDDDNIGWSWRYTITVNE